MLLWTNAAVFLHNGVIGPDEIASYALGTIASLGLAYALSKAMDRFGRKKKQP